MHALSITYEVSDHFPLGLSKVTLRASTKEIAWARDYYSLYTIDYGSEHLLNITSCTPYKD